jgi:hypothetical protein
LPFFSVSAEELAAPDGLELELADEPEPEG